MKSQTCAVARRPAMGHRSAGQKKTPRGVVRTVNWPGKWMAFSNGM